MRELIENNSRASKNTDQSIPFNHIKIGNKYIVSLEIRGVNKEALDYIDENIGFENCVFICIFHFYAEYNNSRLLHFLKDKGVDKDRIIVCPNSFQQKDYYMNLGYKSFRVNWQSCLNKTHYDIRSLEKIYHLVYDGRFNNKPVGKYNHYKRHDLLKGLSYSKAFISVISNENYLADLGISYDYVNKTHIDFKSITEIYNKSKIGIMLSEVEGSCMASGQYLLCGLPVLSVYCKGGREDYYNSKNSLVIEADKESIKSGMETMLSKEYNPEIIREEFLELRRKIEIPELKNMFKTSFNSIKEPIDIESFFNNFIYYKDVGNQWKCDLFKKIGI